MYNPTPHKSRNVQVPNVIVPENAFAQINCYKVSASFFILFFARKVLREVIIKTRMQSNKCCKSQSPRLTRPTIYYIVCEGEKMSQRIFIKIIFRDEFDV